jgi:hypothetical protein
MGAGCGTSQIAGLTTALGENLHDKHNTFLPSIHKNINILKVHSRLG